MKFRAIGWRQGTVAAVVTISVLASTVVATTTFAQSAEPEQETIFTYAGTEEPISLNPIVGDLRSDYTIWAMTYNIPLEFSTADFTPDLERSIVTDVKTSSDNMTFTNTIRPDMLWSDGEPFTAEDIAWTLNFYAKYKFGNYAPDVKPIDTVNATDDTTFVITTKKPTSFYSGATVFLYDYILPEHIWGRYENDVPAAKELDNVPNVGSGPYLISEYEPGQSVTMVKNPNYWGLSAGLVPTYDKIVYAIYNNEDAEASALQNGEIDFAYFDSTSILNALKGNPDIATRGALVPLFEELAINTGSPYQTNPAGGFTPHGSSKHSLTDPVVRRAIRQAINSQTIVDKVLLGAGTAAHSPVQPTATTGDWIPTPEQELPFDIAQANADLDAAGYTMGPDGARIDPFDGEPLEYAYYTRDEDQNTIETAPLVKDWLAQIGVKLNVHSVSSAKLTSIGEAGDYDIYDWGWRPRPDPNYILGIFTCEQRPPEPGSYDNNDSYYCNPGYDRLFDAQSSEVDPQKRIDIVHQMQSILYDDQPYIMLYYNNVLEAYRTDRVTGFTPQPADAPDAPGDLLATFGPFSFISIHPASGAPGGAFAKGASSIVWVVLLIAVLAVVVVVLKRRRRADEDGSV